jgi:hypothetical protein
VKTYVLLAVAIGGLVVLFSSRIHAQASPQQRTLEDIHVVRSLRLSRAEPGEFCSQARTTFPDAMYEDSFSFAAVTTVSHTGAITEALGAQTGSAHACFGSTSDPAVMNFYAEGELIGLRFTGVGKCTTLRSDFPEPGLRIVHCFLNLNGLKEPYVGGLLTSNTIGSRKPLGVESDPPGYVQSSIATVRLWKRREVQSR